MEPEARAFLKRVALSVFIGFFWMAVNSTIGIMYNYAFVEDQLTIGNICFYIWFISSIAGLIWFYVWLWKKPIE